MSSGRDASRITHHPDEAGAGALAVVAAVRAAWLGAWPGGPDLLLRVAGLLPDSRVRDRLRELAQAEPGLSLHEIARRFGSSGYVVASVPLALCGAQRVASLGFQAMLEELVATGGDTDTIAAIAGQVAGTLIGRQALPEDLVARLPDLAGLSPVHFRVDPVSIDEGRSQRVEVAVGGEESRSGGVSGRGDPGVVFAQRRSQPPAVGVDPGIRLDHTASP